MAVDAVEAFAVEVPEEEAAPDPGEDDVPTAFAVAEPCALATEDA